MMALPSWSYRASHCSSAKSTNVNCACFSTAEDSWKRWWNVGENFFSPLFLHTQTNVLKTELDSVKVLQQKWINSSLKVFLCIQAGGSILVFYNIMEIWKQEAWCIQTAQLEESLFPVIFLLLSSFYRITHSLRVQINLTVKHRTLSYTRTEETSKIELSEYLLQPKSILNLKDDV